jgi:hypothetical protein
MLIAVAALCICPDGGLHHHEAWRRAREEKRPGDLSSEGGFELLMRDRYLMLIAILTVLLNIVSLSGDFIFGKLLVDQTNHVVGTAASLMKARKTYIGSYYASYYEWTNAVSLIIQTFPCFPHLQEVWRARVYVRPSGNFSCHLHDDSRKPHSSDRACSEDRLKLCELLASEHCSGGPVASYIKRCEIQSKGGD